MSIIQTLKYFLKTITFGEDSILAFAYHYARSPS